MYLIFGVWSMMAIMIMKCWFVRGFQKQRFICCTLSWAIFCSKLVWNPLISLAVIGQNVILSRSLWPGSRRRIILIMLYSQAIVNGNSLTKYKEFRTGRSVTISITWCGAATEWWAVIRLITDCVALYTID